MALCDEIYLKYPASELADLDEHVVKLWKEGQNRWCVRHHGMTSDEYYKVLDDRLEEGYTFDNDGVGGYGSSGRKPLPKEYCDE